MKMQSGLFHIQTNSLISFHDQYSVLLHQCTTVNELHDHGLMHNPHIDQSVKAEAVAGNFK